MLSGHPGAGTALQQPGTRALHYSRWDAGATLQQPLKRVLHYSSRDTNSRRRNELGVV